MTSPLLVTQNESFAEIVERARAASEVSLDCEFHGEKRYRPTLYLVQINVNDEACAVDASRVDLRPLAPVLENATIRKLFHAGREDIRLLVRASGAKEIANAFDTQIAAAFLGYGLTIGYGKLVKELVGVDLDKSSQFTDWSRALTAEQVDYALNDVRYLPKVAALLRDDLERRGRLEWALEASRTASITALADPDPRRLYRKIHGFAKLDEASLGRLRELAIWRDRVAESENCRPESVANDAGLKQVAQSPPSKHAQLRAMRGLGIGASDRYWSGLHDAIVRGSAEPEPIPPFLETDARVESMALLLGAVRRIVAAEHDVAPELLAASSDLRALAEWKLGSEPSPPELDALGGWRKDLVGALLLEAVRGSVALRVAPQSTAGIEVVRGFSVGQ